jgi:hypothetical protein
MLVYELKNPQPHEDDGQAVGQAQITVQIQL